MKRFGVLFLAFAAAVACAQYPRYGVRFLSQIDLPQFDGSPGSGAAIYGYTSPSGREYATIGLRNGTAVVDITNPKAPDVIEHIPGPNSLWHENVVMGKYCYSVTDSTGVGIQIIDLSQVDAGQANLVGIYSGNNMATVHTIEADVATKRLFANGGTRNFAVLDASNPTALTEIGQWGGAYVHDSVIRNFTTGPWAGKQIGFLCCGTSGLYIVNLTNPANIQVLGTLNYYPGAGNAGKFYSHSASISPDFKYLMINDEFDENQNLTNSCTTIVVDVQDLTNPMIAATYRSGVDTIDHNSFLRDGFLFLSAYKAGVRVYDAKDPLNLKEVGFFDTYPSSTNDNSYNGNWGVYAGFPSGNIVLSDLDRGFFAVDPSEAMGLGAPLTGANLAEVGASGTIADLRKSDDRYLNPGALSRTKLKVFSETTILPRTNLRVTLEAKGSGHITVYMRNQLTGGIVQVGVLNLSAADSSLVVPNLPASAFVTGTGEIECQLGAGGPGGAIRQRIDMLRFDVTP